jgi:nucleoside-diphosphate-sugar epimerase
VSTVLVTGALGYVGSQTVARLHEQGATVLATDIDTPANRKAARRLPSGVDVLWADLTQRDQVASLLADAAPSAIVHLAAVIPAATYFNAKLSRRVNVDATRLLVEVAEQLSERPRFVHASSVAVHGSRNPHHNQILAADSPLNPVDSYGAQKLAAEGVVRQSRLGWLILRLGAVVSTDVRSLPVSADVMFLEWSSPSDGRINTVDVRDVAAAFAAAVSSDVSGEVLMIGGDESHRQLQGDMGPAVAEAMGLTNVYPRGRPGNPNDDSAWFVCDWMDTARAQEVLHFQRHSWPDMLTEIRARVGAWRYVLMALSPIARVVLKRVVPYRGQPGIYADPWGLAYRRWPGARPD